MLRLFRYSAYKDRPYLNFLNMLHAEIDKVKARNYLKDYSNMTLPWPNKKAPAELTCWGFEFDGGSTWNRTRDTGIFNPLLLQSCITSTVGNCSIRLVYIILSKWTIYLFYQFLVAYWLLIGCLLQESYHQICHKRILSFWSAGRGGCLFNVQLVVPRHIQKRVKLKRS